ncbi:POK6 protein, partial [Aramus guarauna]|nr:POK6 protein [Aramus guarauna]
FFAEGNTRADLLANFTLRTPLPQTQAQVQLSHQFFHQSAKVLVKQFGITISDAKLIVQTCPDCQQQPTGSLYMTNPRGLVALQLWQTDVTHVPEFGRQKFVHVSIDTFSH